MSTRVGYIEEGRRKELIEFINKASYEQLLRISRFEGPQSVWFSDLEVSTHFSLTLLRRRYGHKNPQKVSREIGV